MDKYFVECGIYKKQGGSKMKKYLLKIMKYSGTLAVAMALFSQNTTCIGYIHQPKVPSSVKNLKNINNNIN